VLVNFLFHGMFSAELQDLGRLMVDKSNGVVQAHGVDVRSWRVWKVARSAVGVCAA
jgi:hypothetical protein